MQDEDPAMTEAIKRLTWPDARLLGLNNDNAAQTSLLTDQRLRSMLGEAFLATGIGDLDAFLIAFDQDAPYDSPNFLWFRDRFQRFVYVDRVATASACRGRGLAGRLYADLIERAATAGHERICCEVNLVPPNPASDRFHAALGFEEVGQAALHHGTKTVRYLVRPIGRKA
jgi:predicted GNAT superfamily acetyltransferase